MLFNPQTCIVSRSCHVPASRSSSVLARGMHAYPLAQFSRILFWEHLKGCLCCGAVQVLWSGPHSDVSPPGHHIPVCCGAAAHACVVQPQRTAHVAQARGSRALPGEAAGAGRRCRLQPCRPCCTPTRRFALHHRVQEPCPRPGMPDITKGGAGGCSPLME